MLNLLAKIFIKNNADVKNPKVRGAWGLLTSIYTIILNVLIFVVKFVMGTLSGSVSITADSFNNLSDAGSSLLALIGFKFAGMKPTPERPFGHGRIEYVAGLIVSAMILLVGFSTFRDAIAAIRNPEDVEFSLVLVAVLVISIIAKFYMAIYSKRVGEKIDSQVLKACATDNMTDTISTALTLFSLFANHLWGWKIDGWVALIVAVLLFKGGIESGWETLKDLLGKKADPELVKQVEEIAMRYDEIIGVHDLIVHDYGPGRFYISLHCEVPGNRDVYELHDAMDRCMEELDRTLGCESVIHMDPINTDDKVTMEMHDEISGLIREKMGAEIRIHDFRVVVGPTHNNVLFDAVVPQNYSMTDTEAETEIKRLVKEHFTHPTFAIVKIDRPYA